MELEEYLSQIRVKKLSEVKKKILHTLWNEGSGFPRDWVASSRLLEITQQKYFDRRTRELRDECGCDIETKHTNGEHHYRLISTTLNVANPRSYLSEPQKKQLFETAKYTCQVCGIEMQAGVRGLQADHKIPLNRGGSHNAENWQALCNECNVAKRRACQRCEENCKECSWAFPAEGGFPMVVRLSLDTFDYVKNKTKSDPRWLDRVVVDHLKNIKR